MDDEFNKLVITLGAVGYLGANVFAFDPNQYEKLNDLGETLSWHAGVAASGLVGSETMVVYDSARTEIAQVRFDLERPNCAGIF